MNTAKQVYSEEEAFHFFSYDPDKPKKKQSHTTLQKGQSWFGENGCMLALHEPIQKHWRCKVDDPFPSQSPGLSTVYIKPVTNTVSTISPEGCKGMWQLDINLFELVFTHHPLFSTEHVFAQRLLDLYEHYQAREIMDTATSLQDKLGGLKKSEIALRQRNETPAPPSKLKKLRKELRKTSVAFNKERQTDLALVRNMMEAWKCIKALRDKKGFVSTTVKLKMHREKPRCINSSAHGGGDTDRPLVYTDENVTFKEQILCQELQMTQNEERQLPRVQAFVSQRPEHSGLIPVVTRTAVITPTSRCPCDEKERRNKLQHHRISIRIFYNGKHVSTSEIAVLNNDFKVDIKQMFNLQTCTNPENITLEIYETIRSKCTLLAKVFVPVPNRNMVSSSACVERSEFSSDQVVRSHYEGVGSNLPFKPDENEPVMYLLTSGKLMYSVSWAVGDTGFPLAPAVTSTQPSCTRALTAYDDESRLQWIRNLQFDPNHPANTVLSELLKKACDLRDRKLGFFRLRPLEEEFDFTTEEQLDESRRFRLLQLRNCRAPGTVSSKLVPLHDRDITENMLQGYDGSSHSSVVDEDYITSQRTQSLCNVEKILRLARERFLTLKRRYKFSDIVQEHQAEDSTIDFNWDMFRRARPLNSKRAVSEKTSPSAVTNGNLNMNIAVNNARGLPVRLQAHLKEMHARSSCCGLTSSSHSIRRNTEKVMSQAQVQPFVEVRFQETTYESRVEQGPSPCWREEFSLQLKSEGNDYSRAGLSKILDNIVINLFDELSFQVIESSTLRGCGTQGFSGRQWLGSVTIPFRTLLQQSKVCETLRICNPVMLLGYTWPEEDFPHEDGTQIQMDENNSFLDVFIALDPPVSLCSDTTTRLQDEDQRQLWQFPTEEDDRLLDRTFDFEKQCRDAAGGRKRVITMVMSSEGRLVLATRFFRPLPLPEEVLQDVPGGSLMSVLKRVAAFVSLIPVLPFPSDVGDCGDMWFTSEQCLKWVTGNHVSLAVLLCNFFCHLHTKAWLVLGKSVVEGETAYVLTKEHACYTLWNPRDGKHYQSSDSFCPLRSVDCLVNGENVWFNFRRAVNTGVLTFDTSENTTWRPLFNTAWEQESSSVPQEIRYHPPNVDLVWQLQKRMELKLKSCVMDWRRPHPTRWSHHCSAKLSMLLPHLERFPASSSSIKTQMDDLLDCMQNYKVSGFPIQLAYQNMGSVIEAVYNTRIHSTEIPGTEFALGIYVHPYPNYILSVWIFLATLVKHQHGAFYNPQ
ncbi:coiled-coil and C2 domain-containing protein 2A-like [Hypomesus transpacificus]|uniref:coiled-coil and C2 domain-containing protein 2A-like n=1 Tax=Hypomesus transpacificus TaxID=137520 RepID=UPI001F07DC7B|nr:coiled-coil and C2 domain-containing protein 2A-like [Hypomesus transpacificus]